MEGNNDYGSSVMEDIIAFAKAFELDRKDSRKKQDEWEGGDPIEANMKKRIDGYYVWSPKSPADPWMQYEDDMPEVSLALFKLKESGGDFNISQTYPHKDLWLPGLCDHLQ